ncbi:hypothetical protein CR513_57534, partial [Mucuna pruriens]
MPPVIVAIPYVIFQGIEPFENVDDTDNYGGVSDQVVVKIPVDSVFMIFVGPQKQREHLNSMTYVWSSKADKDNSKCSVSVIVNTVGFSAEFETRTKSSNTNYVGRGLASDMKIKPSRVCRFEHLQVPCDYGTRWHQDAPAHSI